MAILQADVTTNTVILNRRDPEQSGEASFSLSNTSGRELSVTVQLLTDKPDAMAWVSFPKANGQPVTRLNETFRIGETRQYSVQIIVPPEAPPGSYAIRLRAAEESLPDENWVETPSVLFEVGQAAQPPKKAFPWWIVAVVLTVLLIVGGVVAFLALRPQEVAQAPTPTSTQTSTQTATSAPTSTSTPTDAPTPTITPTPTPTLIQDLIAQASSAAWISNKPVTTTIPGIPPFTSDQVVTLSPFTPLTFGGSDTDSAGFVLYRDNAQLEDGTTHPRALETHPAWQANGTISGQYTLSSPIQSGDRFRAQVGFISGAGGEVDFVLSISTGGGSTTPQEAGRLHDAGNDGVLPAFDVDLSGFAGQNQVTLIVESGPSSGQDWAVWVNARIER